MRASERVLWLKRDAREAMRTLMVPRTLTAPVNNFYVMFFAARGHYLLRASGPRDNESPGDPHSMAMGALRNMGTKKNATRF